jgi:fructokinase
MTQFGTIELGGTKTLVAAGTSPSDLTEPLRVQTTDPESTIGAVVEHLSRFDLDAIGIAAFGPIELRDSHQNFGSLLNTPKPGWSGYPLLDRVRNALDVPTAIDTDVNGAALGEGTWGSAQGLTNFIYVTVGTGIGGGAVFGDQTIRTPGHPEMGHVIVERHPDDSYAGRCPAHGNCLEGMASGPALEDRFGELGSWGTADAPLQISTFYVAQGLRNLIYTMAPQRIIVGGGVSKIPGFHPRLRSALVETLSGYPGLEQHRSDDYVVAPALGDLSGLAGGLVLASRTPT